MAKVLVVEDDDDIRRLIVMRIRAAGHTVMDVGNAAEALALVLRNGAPEVAVLDVGLPDMLGTDLLIALRQQMQQPDFPAVFLSARVSQEDIEVGRALGAAYLTKPIVHTALLTAIKTAVPSESRGW